MATASIVLVFGTVLVLDGVVERLMVLLGRRMQEGIETDVREYQVTIEDVPEVVADAADFGYLFVRFGSNEQLSQHPSEEEKAKMRLRNNEVDVAQTYDPTDRTLTLDLPLRVHRRLTTEFKLFVDVDEEQYDAAKATLADAEVCAEVSEADAAQPDRLYVLLENLETTTTPEGFQNNLAYPK